MKHAIITLEKLSDRVLTIYIPPHLRKSPGKSCNIYDSITGELLLSVDDLNTFGYQNILSLSNSYNVSIQLKTTEESSTFYDIKDKETLPLEDALQ